MDGSRRSHLNQRGGLAGQNVTLQVKAGTWDVYLIAGKDYRNADGSFSTAG